MEKTRPDVLTLKDLRKQAELSQQDLANRLNLSLSAIRNWERGDSLPHLDNAVELAKVLNVDLYTICEAFGLDIRPTTQ
jgi:transcriptional regulator with XRE-family HTH domain